MYSTWSGGVVPLFYLFPSSGNKVHARKHPQKGTPSSWAVTAVRHPILHPAGISILVIAYLLVWSNYKIYIKLFISILNVWHTSMNTFQWGIGIIRKPIDIKYRICKVCIEIAKINIQIVQNLINLIHMYKLGDQKSNSA